VCVCVCVCVCLIMCDLETSTVRQPSPELGRSATENNFNVFRKKIEETELLD